MPCNYHKIDRLWVYGVKVGFFRGFLFFRAGCFCWFFFSESLVNKGLQKYCKPQKPMFAQNMVSVRLWAAVILHCETKTTTPHHIPKTKSITPKNKTQ